MTSDKLIRKVASDNGMTIKDVRAMAGMFESALKDYVKSGENVKFCDVSFNVKDVPETTRFNPIEKKPIVCPATKRLTTKASAGLKRVAKGISD